MSKLQRDLQHIVLLDTEANDYALRDLSNRTIYDYWRYTPVFSDFFISQSVPDWQLNLLKKLSYARLCRVKWFKDLCRDFRSYLMRHFYCVERRDVLKKYTLTHTKKIDFGQMFDL